MSTVEGGFTIWARQTIESEIFFYKPAMWFKIWFYIVNKALWLSSRQNSSLKRGEALITYSDITANTGASKQQAKDCVHYLEKDHMIESRKTTRGMVRFVVNYEIYQDVKNYKTTSRPQSRPLGDHSETLLINNKDNKEKIYTAENLTIKQIADRLVDLFKKVTSRTVSLPPDNYKNLDYWLGIYNPESITQAIKNIPNDDYWRDVITPTILFRRFSKGQPVDYIGSLIGKNKAPPKNMYGDD